MKNLLITLGLLIAISAMGQSYSSFYGAHNVNSNVTIKQNINVSGKVKTESTIHTIDYGALAQANALQEANRLKRKQYNDQRAKQIGIDIANNPIIAYKYGRPALHQTLRSWAINRGIRPKYGVFFIAPNAAIFDRLEYNQFRNVSSSGVTAEFSIELPYKYLSMITNPKVKEIWSEEQLENFKLRENNPREVALPSWMEKGSDYTWGYLHDIELYTANIYGSDGFRGTIKYEDEFNIYIEDTYVAALKSGLYGSGKIIVSYKGDKRSSTFEELEGRRYYLKPLIEKTIANAEYPRTKADMKRMRIYNY